MMSSFPDSFFQAQKKIWERTAQQWKEICINLLKIYSIHLNHKMDLHFFSLHTHSEKEEKLEEWKK